MSILGRSFPRRQVNDIAPASFALSGTSSNGSYSGYAEIGSSLSALFDTDPPDSIVWGTSVDASDYGSGVPFTVPGTNDTGDRNAPAQLFYTATYGLQTVRGSLDIRAAAISVDTPAAIAAAGSDLGDTITLTPSALSGLPAVLTRALVMTRDGASFLSNTGGANLTHDIVAADDDLIFDGTDTIETSSEIVSIDATGAVQVTDFVAPAFPTGAGSISGVLEDGETLTYTPASNGTGNPVPTSSVQWLNVSDNSVAATGLTIVAAEGANLYVRETLANGISPDATANTAATGVIAAASSPATNYARNFTADVGDEVIDLGAVFTPNGSASYALTAYAGASLSTDQLTIDTDTAATGNVTVTLTDDDGTRNLVLALTITTASIGSDGSVTLGTDTDPAVVFTLTPIGGDYDGVPVSFTLGDINGLSAGEGFPALAPVIGFTTDADSDGEADVSDVITLVREGLWLYPDGQTAPTITTSLRDASSQLLASGADYTATGSEDTNIFYRETDGTTNSNSAAVLVDAAVGGSIIIGAVTEVVNSTATAAAYASGTVFGAAPAPSRAVFFAVNGHVRPDAHSSTGVVSLVWNGVTAELVGVSPSNTTPYAVSALFMVREANIPAAGTVTANVDTSWSSCTVHAVEMSGVDQTTPFGTAVGANTVDNMALTLTEADSYQLSTASMTGDRLPVTEATTAALLASSQSGTTGANDHTAAVAGELVGAAGANTHDFDFTSPNTGSATSVTVEVYAA